MTSSVTSSRSSSTYLCEVISVSHRSSSTSEQGTCLNILEQPSWNRLAVEIVVIGITAGIITNHHIEEVRREDEIRPTENQLRVRS